MPLHKSLSNTPARREASRRNAKISTGPRTARGKAQSCLNGLESGNHSPLLKNFLSAPPGAACETTFAALTPAQAAHPLFAENLKTLAWAETGTLGDESESNPGKKMKGSPKVVERSLNVIENTKGQLGCL